MTLQEYIKQLQELLDENPEAALSEVWYARDEEGNGYERVNFPPSLQMVEKSITAKTDFVHSLQDIDELAAESGVYLEDFTTESDFKKAALEAVEKEYKTVVVIN